MKDVEKWRRSLQKCSKLENERVQVIGYIGQRMAWRITLLKVVSRFYRLHSFTLLAANTTTGLINYVYPPGSLHNNVTGDFLNERAILATTNHDVAEINDSIVRDRMTGQLKFKLSADRHTGREMWLVQNFSIASITPLCLPTHYVYMFKSGVSYY